ncbi:hypothetical protein L1987_57429 [Smallanthus sonchifolius]|uniref:Uncharacterized protein n=1 Tax=Smallanthus sonchifolius TaxID=185202 RepID=A0ACB9DCZ4_9ASTR|nr:hypothetical protein L1987_57429 [Smallanthus sonchifolius]
MAPAMQLALLALFITGATAYTNHTVGGPAGWLFDPKTNTSSANYASWAANQTFHLGDYLIFKTNSNIQMLVLTYNETTFCSCSVDDSSDGDTFIYGQEREEYGEPLAVVIPLTIEGTHYFFSDASDGIQCENGMAFGINVSHGVDESLTLAVTNQPSGDGVNARRAVCYALAFYGISALFLVFGVKLKGGCRIRKQVR